MKIRLELYGGLKKYSLELNVVCFLTVGVVWF
jgi:hypothetical protein